MKKLFLLAGLFAIVSCQRNEQIIPEAPHAEDGLTITTTLPNDLTSTSNDVFSFTYKVPNEDRYFKMDAEKQNDVIHSILSYKSENQDWQKINEVTLNTAEENYREGMNQQIVDAAEQLKTKYDYAYLSSLESVVEQLPIFLFEELGAAQYSQDQPLTIFFHLGALKTAKRALESPSKICQCTAFANYTHSESPFFCAEDKVVSRAKLIEVIEQKVKGNQFASKTFQAEQVLAYLRNTAENQLSVSKVDRIMKDEFNTFWITELTEQERNRIAAEHDVAPENSRRLPYDLSCLLYGADSGSDCGCCGNYSGGCWYCSLACYIHDETCETCTPEWYCLSGCVAGEC